MKKAINKSEREEILIALVVEASLKSAQKICNKLFKLREQVHTLVQGQWEDSMPGISKAQQLELLRSGGANALAFGPSVYGAIGKGGAAAPEGDFATLTWRNDGIADTALQRMCLIMARIFNGVPGRQGKITDGVSTSWYSKLSFATTFPDVIRGFQPSQLYRIAVAPETQDNAYAGNLLDIHDEAVSLFIELKDLLFSAEEMYHSVGAVIAPLKTAQALAEAMPEAVKHFPASLTYVKPTKQIADPKAINEIRAKLAKGLPI